MIVVNRLFNINLVLIELLYLSLRFHRREEVDLELAAGKEVIFIDDGSRWEYEYHKQEISGDNDS